ncbi:MAG: hypothetical protein ABJH68_05835 [Ilumatobacter sp.]|uniref:hypothetical protein n=1 Tax=Ilumatobacter sp. TaxID=1967498 RepID=UPI003296849F
MRYPILTRSTTESLAREMVATGFAPNWELERTWVGSGQEVDLGPLGAAMADMRETFESRDPKAVNDSPEAFEGRFAGDVHRALRDLPIEALDDPGFWRFLSLVDFWWFVAIREAPAIGRGNVMTYVNGGKECVPFRMFLRAQAIRRDDDYSLAGALPKAADFWRSHVLRVKTGTAPPLARSFARLQKEKLMVSDDVRPFARRINRLWSNIVFQEWEDDDCDKLLAGLYAEMHSGQDSHDEPRSLES